jgi:hypothetical protein
LASILVAVLGAIVLGGINLKSGGGSLTMETLRATAGGAEVAMIFRWVFATCALVLGTALAALILMEERPLPGRADIPAAAPGAPAAE